MWRGTACTNYQDRYAFCYAEGKTLLTQVFRPCNAYKSTVPCFSCLAQPTVRVFGCFGKHLGLSRRPCAKRLSSSCILLGLWVRRGRFKPRLARVGCVVAGAAFSVETPSFRLAFLTRPRRCLSHTSPWRWCRYPWWRKYPFAPKYPRQGAACTASLPPLRE